MASSARAGPDVRQTYTHFSRKLQHSVSQLRGEGGVPADLLTAAAAQPVFCGGSGFPEGDALCYDPVQGLLAVGTADGRVKLIGRPGVEATLRAPGSRAPTTHLSFLRHAGALLRVTQAGDLQLFSAASRRLLTSTWVQGDSITSVAVLPGDPYVLLGCESGAVRVAGVLDLQAQPAEAGRAACDLALQPYQVLPEELVARGPVVAVAVAAQDPSRPLLLVVHRDSGALVWDIRDECVLCAALEEEGEASKPTCACWVGARANCFAVGYDDGSVLVWGVPQAALQGGAALLEPAEAQALFSLRVPPRGTQAAPLRSLAYLPGERGEDCLLLFGGQAEGEPDMLTLLPLAAGQQELGGSSGARAIPWFGNIKSYCLVPAEGLLGAQADGPPRAVMILTEGGQLVVHSLQEWQPMPLTLPLQELPPVTVAKVVCTVSAALLEEEGQGAAGWGGGTPRPSPGSAASSPSPSRSGAAGAAAAPPPQHALTLDRVRACSRRLPTASQEGGGPAAELGDWPFAGGMPAAAAGGGGSTAGRHPSALYLTGHRDGRVRVWDATAQVPQLLLAVPAGAVQERLRPVTAIEVCSFSGLLLVGHQGGDARLYQFADSAQEVRRHNIDEALLPYEHLGAQPAGFQYVLRYGAHAADVTSLALSSKLKLAAVADAAGNISLLDLMQPVQLFCVRPLGVPAAALSFGSHVVPAGRDVGEQQDEERLVLFVAGADSSTCMLGLDRGTPVGKVLRPKNASRPLCLVLLDERGIPLQQLHGQVVLPWANNNSALAARSLAMTKAVSLDPGAEGASGRLSQLSLGQRTTSSPEPSAAGSRLPSRRPTAADSMRSWSRGGSVDPESGETEGSVEVQELASDDELDAHLAAAATAADAGKRSNKGRFNLGKAFSKASKGGAPRRGAQQQQQQGAADAGGDLPSPSAAPSFEPAAVPEQQRSSSGVGSSAFDPVSALHDFYGGTASPPGSNPSSPQPSLPLPRSPAGGGSASLEPEQLLTHSDLVDYPYLIDADPSPASFLLLCTEDYLRLYPTENLRLGDRSTLRKASFDPPLLFAAPFLSTHGPGVASLTADGALQLHSVPGLEPLLRTPLESSGALGFFWAPAEGGAAGAACACSPDGQLLLVGAGNEVTRLALVRDCALPAPPASTYDWGLAQAAAAAAAAAGTAAAAQGGASSSGGATAPTPRGRSGLDAVSGAGGKGFGRFFDQVRDTASGVATSVVETASKLPGAVMQELDRVKAGGAPQPLREPPSLAVLFATPVGAVEDDDIDYMVVEDSPREEEVPQGATAAPAAAAAAGAAGTASAAPSGSKQHPAVARVAAAAAAIPSPRETAARLKQLLPVRGVGGKAESSREELPRSPAASLDAAAGSPGGSGGGGGRAALFTRTASEIKRTYGKPGASSRGAAAASDVRGVMEQNRAMLMERGERLRQLNERSDQLQGDASDFASNAKKLADMYSNRKWWQL